MKISFNRKIVDGPWGGGNNFLRLLTGQLEKNGVKISFSIDNDTDIIFITENRENLMCFNISSIMAAKNRGVRIIQRINDTSIRSLDETKDLDKKIIFINRNLADKTIFVSNWVMEYFKSQGLIVNRAEVIWNGSDRRLFRSNGYHREKAKPLNIISHHWSQNILKGYNIYSLLDDFCYKNPEVANFTFMGRSPPNCFKHCRNIPAQPYQDIPPYFVDRDVYVSASFCEAGANHIMEGLSCGLIPIIKFDSGSCVEYTSGFNFVFKDFQDLIDILSSLFNNYEKYVSYKSNAENFKYGSDDMYNSYVQAIMTL